MRLRVLLPLALLAFASPAQAAVGVGHSGWQWGNPQPQGNTLNAVDFAGGTGYAAGNFGTVLRTDDSGATWRALPAVARATDCPASVRSFWFVTEQTGYVLRSDGSVARTD